MAKVELTVEIPDDIGGGLHDLLTDKEARKAGLVPSKPSFRACLEAFAAEAIEGWYIITRNAAVSQRKGEGSREARAAVLESSRRGT
jgi:hypothetical protein